MNIDKILYRTQKDKTLLDFDGGAMTRAVGEDLIRSGIKDPTRFVFGASAALAKVKKIKDDRAKAFAAKKVAKPASPYVQLGIAGKDLICQIKDAASTFEENATMLKDYVGAKEKIKKAKAAVLNVHDEDDDTVENAVKGLAKGKGVQAQDAQKAGDAELGDITGDVMLCAHGTPATKPGRVMGVELGAKTAAEIVSILTGSKDKAKRISKKYSGKIILVGCFTASGGPEADKADDPFAK